MTRIGRCVMVILALQCAPTVARAQLGEVHLGALVSYGLPNSHGPGVGIAIGVATGRLTYLGVRWAYHVGSAQADGTALIPVEVTSRTQTFAADLGFLLPVGAVEIVPGISLGVSRFAQRNSELGNAGSKTEWASDIEFVAGPGVSIHTRFAGLLFIPELQYVFGSDPELPWRVQHRGPVATMRIAFALEVGRFRH
jgi:hypothetical protein